MSKKLSGQGSTSNVIFKNRLPFISQGLGMSKTCFSGGRIGVDVADHGGITDIVYYGRQNLGASRFFSADPVSAWKRLFRVFVNIDGKLYYLTLHNTRLYPFGYASEFHAVKVILRHELLVLNDAVVQRVKVLKNPDRRKISLRMMHYEFVRTPRDNRTWREIAWNQTAQLLSACAVDVNPTIYKGGDALAQAKTFVCHDAPRAETWIGVGASLAARAWKTHSTKWYIETRPFTDSAALFVALAPSKPSFQKRIKELQSGRSKGGKTRGGVLAECNALRESFDRRLQTAPGIELADPAVESALTNMPPIVDSLKVKDIPGGIRASGDGYWIWGWDSIVHSRAYYFSGDAAFGRAQLAFWKKLCDKRLGIPHQLTTQLTPRLAQAFPAQTLYSILLYDDYVFTGDKAVLSEYYSTAKWILDKALEQEMQQTGMIEGVSLFPDYPEFVSETGHDLSSFNNSIVYQAARGMAILAAELGKAADARQYADFAQRCRNGFQRYFFDPAKGFFVSSCDSKTFRRRPHYPLYAVLWVTPFARELVTGKEKPLAEFMRRYFYLDVGLFSFPRWDTCFMADGNQIGAWMPVIEPFYYHIMRLAGKTEELRHWFEVVGWYWRRHTVPEGITSESENEGITLDSPGGKQLFSARCWYGAFFDIFAGIEASTEGMRIDPPVGFPLRVSNLRIRGRRLDVVIGNKGKIRVNGRSMPQGMMIKW